MKVLIADDRLYMRAALRGYLALHTSLEVCAEARDGVEAITQARRHRPDLILMDLAMPNISGAEAALVVKNILPEVRIILFTLYGDLAGQAVAKAAGIDCVLPKADGATGLTNALQMLLPQQSLKKSNQVPAPEEIAEMT